MYLHSLLNSYRCLWCITYIGCENEIHWSSLTSRQHHGPVVCGCARAEDVYRKCSIRLLAARRCIEWAGMEFNICCCGLPHCFRCSVSPSCSWCTMRTSTKPGHLYSSTGYAHVRGLLQYLSTKHIHACSVSGFIPKHDCYICSQFSR